MSEEKNYRDDIYSNAVRAGKRTYFFDVRSTRGNDLYLTITESKRRYADDGKFHYEKHKLFLYKEDFEKFADGLGEAIDKIKELQQNGEFAATESPSHEESSEAEEPVKTARGNEEYSTDVSFEDLED